MCSILRRNLYDQINSLKIDSSPRINNLRNAISGMNKLFEARII